MDSRFRAVCPSAGRALVRTAPLDRAAVGRLEQRYRTVGSAPRDRRGGDDKRIEMSTPSAQTNLENLSDEEFVALLLETNQENLLSPFESKLFGLDLEVMDFVEMAG